MFACEMTFILFYSLHGRCLKYYNQMHNIYVTEGISTNDLPSKMMDSAHSCTCHWVFKFIAASHKKSYLRGHYHLIHNVSDRKIMRT